MKNPFNHDHPPADTPLVNVQVDGVWMQMPKGLNAVEVARRAGKFIPHYCYHPKLAIVGNCRMCLIETGGPKLDASRAPVLDASGKPEINWIPRPAIGCATQVNEGTAIRTTSPLIDECRKGVMEFLLINHPLDCPICDQAGECKLQEYSVEYGNDRSRFVEEKVKKPKRVDLGERIVLDDERCVMCSRCIRFAKDTMHDDVLGFTERGSHTTLAVHPGHHFDNNYSLNTVDICPVGALTSKDFRFQMRVWFLKETKSICTGCATGCNTIIGSREGTVHRQTPRENEAVNSEWMCDQGRLGFHYIHSEKRLTAPISRRGPENTIAAWSEIIPQVAEKLKGFTADQIGIVASGRMTNEEAFLVSEIRRVLGGDAVVTDLVPRVGEADGFLRSADLNPNTNGVTLMGLSKEGRSLPALRSATESGKIRALFVLHEDLVADAGWPAETLQKLDTLVYLGLLQNATSDRADFIFPGASFAEKRGSMINAAGRLQRLNRAIVPPGQALDDWQILIRLKEALGGGNGLHTIEDTFKAMAAKVPAFAGLTMSRIGDLGIELQPAGVASQMTTPLFFADMPAEVPLWVPDVFVTVIKIFVLVNVILGLVSYTVMAERKISAAIQDRIGPNRTGLPLGGVTILGFTIPVIKAWGLGQPLADALKFMLKEEFTPAHVNKFFFWLAPAMAMVPALLTICVIPFGSSADIYLPFFNYTMHSPGVIANVGIGVLLVFAIASLGVYGIVLAGWASNSKYPFLGGIRSSAQMISYEVSMGLSVIPIFLVMGDLRLSDVVDYQFLNGWTVLPFVAHSWPLLNWKSYVLWLPMAISFIVFLVSSFAETNRLPFDLPESETELVGGYHTEYAAMKFALFFLGEYAAMIVASCLMVTLFLGGWGLPFRWYLDLQTEWYSLIIFPVVFLLKMLLFIVFFIWIRWTLPRFRYDQLMGLGWKCILPISLGNIVLTCVLLAITG